VLLGGPRAWAGGGWAGTSLEDRLAPLRVGRDPGGRADLVVALDRSGSTTGPTLPLLVRAVADAAAALAPGERLAVLPFSEAPDAALVTPGWVAFGEAERAASLRDALAALVPSGGTDLVLAVDAAAARAAAEPDASRRVVILLTDGDPDQPPSEEALRALRARADERGVRILAIVSGDAESAARLRRTLARAPADVVLLEDPREVPAALARLREGMRHEELLLPGPFSVRVLGADPRGLSEGPTLPAIHRLEVSPGAVPLAEAVRLDGTAAPLAARRALGAGDVIALAYGPGLDPDPVAATSWLRPVAVQAAASADRGLAVGADGDRWTLLSPEHAGAGGLLVRDREGTTATFAETAPGVFEAPAGPADLLLLDPVRGGPVRPLRLPARPLLEHRGVGVDAMALRAIAAAGGGRRLLAGERPPPTRAPGGRPLAPFLLLSAVALFVAERALSRPSSSHRAAAALAGTSP
jgi:hypothetical protein